MKVDDHNDDTLEQATTLLRDVPLPAFPMDAIAQQLRARIKPITPVAPTVQISAAIPVTASPSPMRIGRSDSRSVAKSRPLSWMSRIAAMIAVSAGLLAVGWAMFRSNPVIAFSVAAERLHSVHALGADLIINSGGMEIHGSIDYAAPGRFRVTIPGAAVEILDINLGKLVLLNNLDKSATVLNLDDAPSDLKRQELDWIEKLRNVGRDAGKPIGVATINGVRAMEFSVMDDGQEMFVWSDIATGEPIRIEAKLVSGKDVVTMMLDHLTINPQIDEKQFSITVPPGYATQSGHVSAAKITEEDLTAFLKEYVARTGSFPPSLVDFKRSLQQMVSPTTHPAESSAAQTDRKRVDGPDASFFETVTRATRALLYLNQLSQTSSWYYAGAAAHPGDVSQPIFWYRTGSTGNFTIIHGDYHVSESPAAPASAGAESPAPAK